jgi:hypothetical protein
LTAALLLCLGASLARAQSATGDIQGTVVDQSGAVLPGATVTVSNTATSVQRELITDTEGRFSAPGLQVGALRIRHAAARGVARAGR